MPQGGPQLDVVQQTASEKPVRSFAHRDSNEHAPLTGTRSEPSVFVTGASSDEGDEMVTMQVEEPIDAAGDDGSRFSDAVVGTPIGDRVARGQRASGITLSMLVLSTAAVLFGLLCFLLGLWVDARTDEAHLVDTADCQVIASTSASSLEWPGCDESIDSPIVSGSTRVKGALPSPSILGPSRVVAAPGLWIHSILQSVG